MLETLDYTIRIGSTPTFLYFDLYLYSAYAAHHVYECYNAIMRTEIDLNECELRTLSQGKPGLI